MILDPLSPTLRDRRGGPELDYISADSKVQASIKRETEVKPIQSCRFHSGALDELASQRSTGKYSLLFFKLGHIALTFLSVIRLVEVQDSVVIKR